MKTSQQTLLKLYQSILRIRRVEEQIASRYKEEKMRCPVHLCIGQEAVPAGVCEALEPRDPVYSNHRAHGHYLAKGGDLGRFLAELYGKAAGCAGGFGGSMHLIDLKVGFIGCTPIVGSTLPIAVGAAWASLLKGSGEVATAFFGDGCFEEGVMHECLNFAVLKKLPILFVCENNLYSVYTPLKERQPDRAIHQVAKAHGCKTYSGDGNDAALVYETTCRAVEDARRGGGPQFLEFSTFRWLEHCGPDDDNHLAYRAPGEIEEWKTRCPLKSLHDRLIAETPSLKPRLDRLEEETNSEIQRAFEFALASPPAQADLKSKVYAG